jgi:OmpA-OmpF porin, OOP family
MRNSMHGLLLIFTLAAAAFVERPAAAQKSAVPAQGPKAVTAFSGMQKKVAGTITYRNGDNLTLRLASSETLAVKLSGFTQIREKKSNPLRKGRKYYSDQLTAGLAVEVEGRGDSSGALVAEKILLTNDDLKTAQLIDARVAPVEVNEIRMSGQINELGAISNSARGGAKAAQETADSAHTRITALDDYDSLRNLTIKFKVGSAALSEEARRSLDELALQVKDLKGYVIEVAGFASSEGNLALNRRLSRQRADAVSEYLAEQHDIPLRRIMIPTGYGISHPVSDNSTSSGRQENRRVEVRLLVSRGLTTQISANQPAVDSQLKQSH